MENLKHVMTFEQYSVNETETVNEGLFTSIKTDIDKFLKNPVDENKANKLLGNAFASTFAKIPPLKTEVLELPLETKVGILTQASEKLGDSKIGVLKLFKNTKGEYTVGGVGLAAHTGGGKKG